MKGINNIINFTNWFYQEYHNIKKPINLLTVLHAINKKGCLVGDLFNYKKIIIDFEDNEVIGINGNGRYIIEDEHEYIGLFNNESIKLEDQPENLINTLFKFLPTKFKNI